jgi:ubiquinone biosynthesis monooxygenase Coq7
MAINDKNDETMLVQALPPFLMFPFVSKSYISILVMHRALPRQSALLRRGSQFASARSMVSAPAAVEPPQSGDFSPLAVAPPIAVSTTFRTGAEASFPSVLAGLLGSLAARVTGFENSDKSKIVRRQEKLDSMLRVNLAGETAAVRICLAQKAVLDSSAGTHSYWLAPPAVEGAQDLALMTRARAAGKSTAPAKREASTPSNPDPFVRSSHDIVQEILDEEIHHLDVMMQQAEKHRVRPTVMDPLWYVGSYALGTVTAFLGREALMCSHAAIEEVVTEHYNDQLRQLLTDSDFLPEPTAAEQQSGEAAAATTGAANPEVDSAVEELRAIVERFRDDEQHHHELGMQHGGANALPGLYPMIKGVCIFGLSVSAWL